MDYGLFNMRVFLRHPKPMAVKVNLVEVTFLTEQKEPLANFRMAVGAIRPFEGVGISRWPHS